MSVLCQFNRGAAGVSIYRPSTYASSNATLTNPTNAYDSYPLTHGDVQTPSNASGTATFTLSGFPAGTVTGTLKMLTYATSAGSDGAAIGTEKLDYSLNGGSTWTNVFTQTNHIDRGTPSAPILDSVALTAQDMTQVQVRATGITQKISFDYDKGIVEVFDVRIEA